MEWVLRRSSSVCLLMMCQGKLGLVCRCICRAGRQGGASCPVVLSHLPSAERKEEGERRKKAGRFYLASSTLAFRQTKYLSTLYDIGTYSIAKTHHGQLRRSRSIRGGDEIHHPCSRLFELWVLSSC